MTSIKLSIIEISIVVPVYNVEKYLNRCIDSILEQTYPHFELLLINDGSTDSSPIVCDKYAKTDNRVKVFHKENSGVSSTRNLGIKLAKGKYICFFDSDDWVEKDILMAYIAYFKKQPCDLIFQGIVMEFPNKQIRHHLQENFYELTDIKEAVILLERSNLLGWSSNKIFKLEIIKKEYLLFRENISMQEDAIFTLEYLRHTEKMAIINNTLYHYRILNTSLAHKRISYFILKTINQLLYVNRVEIYGSSKAKKKYAIDMFNAFLRMYEKHVIIKYNSRLVEINEYKTFVLESINKNSFKESILKVVIRCLPVCVFDVFLKVLSNIKMVLLTMRNYKY